MQNNHDDLVGACYESMLRVIDAAVEALTTPPDPLRRRHGRKRLPEQNTASIAPPCQHTYKTALRSWTTRGLRRLVQSYYKNSFRLVGANAHALFNHAFGIWTTRRRHDDIRTTGGYSASVSGSCGR